MLFDSEGFNLVLSVEFLAEKPGAVPMPLISSARLLFLPCLVIEYFSADVFETLEEQLAAWLFFVLKY